MADPEFYRRKEETERWKALDPIVTFSEKLKQDGVVDDSTLQALQTDVEAVVNEATRFAEESPHPSPEALYRDLYREQEP
jgi:pyruvate dehydrogenase E1 component alpha subunit